MFWNNRTELLLSTQDNNTPNQQGETTFVAYILITIITIFVRQIIFNSHKLFFSAAVGHYFTSN